MNVMIDTTTRTVRPVDLEGDRLFGLELGTNGTAAECRRELVTPRGHTWLRHNGSQPRGLWLTPPKVEGNAVWRNPWLGVL